MRYGCAVFATSKIWAANGLPGSAASALSTAPWSSPMSWLMLVLAAVALANRETGTSTPLTTRVRPAGFDPLGAGMSWESLPLNAVGGFSGPAYQEVGLLSTPTDVCSKRVTVSGGANASPWAVTDGARNVIRPPLAAAMIGEVTPFTGSIV